MSTRHTKGESFGGEAEKYSTPLFCVRRLNERIGSMLPGGNWLEPAAGDGNLIRGFDRVDRSWTVVEIGDCTKLRETCIEVHASGEEVQGDFFLFARSLRRDGTRFDVAVTNPPNSHAERFLEEMRSLASMVLMFLPWPWYGGTSRSALFGVHPPSDIFLIPDRVQFIDPTVKHPCPKKCGGSGECTRCDGTGEVQASSPSVDYAWFLWQRVQSGPTRCHRLDATPLHERQWWKETA